MQEIEPRSVGRELRVLSAHLYTAQEVLMCSNLNFDDKTKIFLQKIDKKNMAPPEKREIKH